MALDATLREKLLGLTAEEKAEVRRLLSNDEDEPEWLRAVRRVQAASVREGVWIDAVAEVRAARDEMG